MRAGPSRSEHRSRNYYRVPFRHCIPRGLLCQLFHYYHLSIQLSCVGQGHGSRSSVLALQGKLFIIGFWGGSLGPISSRHRPVVVNQFMFGSSARALLFLCCWTCLLEHSNFCTATALGHYYIFICVLFGRHHSPLFFIFLTCGTHGTQEVYPWA